jgi:hypothetical protein
METGANLYGEWSNIGPESMVKFDGEEMVLTDDKGAETRHRRPTGPIPDKYQ